LFNNPNAQQQNPFANLFNNPNAPQQNANPFASLFQNFQGPTPNVNNNSQQAFPEMPFAPLIQQFLSNPQALLALVPTFMPMIINSIQSTTMEQRQRIVEHVKGFVTNNPDFGNIVSQLLQTYPQILEIAPEFRTLVDVTQQSSVRV
jgi:hypothetical protein